MSRRIILCGLVLLMVSVACGDSSCGGCVEPPAEPFPTGPRVYDGVQMRITQSGFDFIENNLPVIDYDKCTACGACVEKCPTGAMTG